MAYDKVVDSAKLDNDLKKVSSAILNVCGWGRPLSFPDEFEWAVAGVGKDFQFYKDFNKSFTHISSNISTISDSLFLRCTDLITAEFPNAIAIGKWAFQNCSSLNKINCPIAENISTNSFAYAERLKEAFVPNATIVGTGAFYNCIKLKELDFHKVGSIHSQAFDGCYSMTALILRGTNMCTLSSVNALDRCYHFYGTVDSVCNPQGLQDGYIYVPSSLIEEYKSATNWSSFVDRFRALEDYTVDGTTMGALDPTKI